MIYFEYLLYLAQAGFTIWMLVDAYRRQADYFWLWVILLVPGLGAWAYFFAVKASDYAWLKDLSLWHRRPSLAELRYRAEQVPTLSNRLDLAERLVEEHAYAEALPHLEAVLAQEAGLSRALSALAVCHHGQGQSAEAVALLEQLIAHDAGWRNYAAWRLLITVHNECGDGGKALTTCRELVRVAPTLEHHCLLAECLLSAGMADEARRLLDRSLQDHEFAPGYIRRRNRRWASQARRLRKQAVSDGIP
jgi:hypothetical protein